MEFTFIETPVFTKIITELLDDEEYKNFQAFLARDVRRGPFIPGSGGLRKIRWGFPRRQKGKRGGIRIIYCVYLANQIYMIFAYDKNEQEDLSRGQLKILRDYVKKGVI